MSSSPDDEQIHMRANNNNKKDRHDSIFSVCMATCITELRGARRVRPVLSVQVGSTTCALDVFVLFSSGDDDDNDNAAIIMPPMLLGLSGDQSTQLVWYRISCRAKRHWSTLFMSSISISLFSTTTTKQEFESFSFYGLATNHWSVDIMTFETRPVAFSSRNGAIPFGKKWS